MAMDERVRAIIVEQLGVSAEEIKPEASFISPTATATPRAWS